MVEGNKCFLVGALWQRSTTLRTTPDNQYWRRAAPDHRHYYELIPANTPCRLYLDLEFERAPNPELDSSQARLDRVLARTGF
jgi:hypothetical protein